MRIIQSIEALEELYEPAVQTSLDKVASEITPLYRQWIEASRFVILSTVGPEGTDASPRGDDCPVVSIENSTELILPDWRGNNRLDSLRNIVRDKRVSLMFMVPGSNNVVRINGEAVVTDEPSIVARFEKAGKFPRSVIIVRVVEIYFQCAKALMRSKLWSSEDESAGLPTAGDFIKQFNKEFAARAYDENYAENAKSRMW